MFTLIYWIYIKNIVPSPGLDILGIAMLTQLGFKFKFNVGKYKVSLIVIIIYYYY